jgi:hypothetical protein
MAQHFALVIPLINNHINLKELSEEKCKILIKIYDKL